MPGGTVTESIFASKLQLPETATIAQPCADFRF